eukprot:2275085-Amphidinium_carterae.1
MPQDDFELDSDDLEIGAEAVLCYWQDVKPAIVPWRRCRVRDELANGQSQIYGTVQTKGAMKSSRIVAFTNKKKRGLKLARDSVGEEKVKGASGRSRKS